MAGFASRFVGSVLAALTVSTAALGQSYYDDQGCRQFADAQIAPLRDQANSQAFGSTLLGASLGAAVGGAVGGGWCRGRWRLVARSAAVAGRGSARRPVRSSAAVLAPPTPRTRRDTCSSSITLIMRSAWRPGDSRHRHMLRRRPLIHHPPHMPHHQGIPQAQAIPRHRLSAARFVELPVMA
jgi:hypothetical protein